MLNRKDKLIARQRIAWPIHKKTLGKADNNRTRQWLREGKLKRQRG